MSDVLDGLAGGICGAMTVMVRMIALCSVGLLTCLSSCTTQTKIDKVRELTVHSTADPSMDTGLYRAQRTYIMHGALTHEERQQRLGQYYYVTWKNARSKTPLKLVMEYQLSSTGSKVHSKTLSFPKGVSRGIHTSQFQFTGDEYRKSGKLLTWRLTLWENGKFADSHQSYLWRDDRTTSGRLPTPSIPKQHSF